MCKLSEASYAILRYTRSYSIVVIAVYRALAVYRINLYKKIALSLKFSILSAIFTWIITIIIFLLNKYSTGAIPGKIICFDGSGSKFASAIYNTISIILVFVYLLLPFI